MSATQQDELIEDFSSRLFCAIRSSRFPRLTILEPEHDNTDQAEEQQPKNRSTRRSLETLWKKEGVTKSRSGNPPWPNPKQEQELQVVDYKDIFHVFTGKMLWRRLGLITASAFAVRTTKEGDRPPIAGIETVDDRLVIRISLPTLGRLAGGEKSCTHEEKRLLGRQVLHEDWELSRPSPAQRRNQRFFDGLFYVHSAFMRLVDAYPDFRQYALPLCYTLLQAMLKAGKSRPELVEFYLDALEVMIRGNPQNQIERFILLEIRAILGEQAGREVQIYLYRMRRVFYKDDMDLLQNAKKAVERMCQPPTDISHVEVEDMLQLFRAKQKEWIKSNDAEIRMMLKKGDIHRASASVAYSRLMGGGSAEMHLIVGLFRLSKGQSSRLSNVFGEFPDHPNLRDLQSCIHFADHEINEIYDAMDWFIDEMFFSSKREPLLRPFICIHPERESKARTFQLLDYACQLAGSLYMKPMTAFLVSTGLCTEAFKGMDTSNLMKTAQEVIRGDPHIPVLSIDSSVATDSLSHEAGIAVFDQFDEFMPPFARKALKLIFGPTRCAAATTRPRFCPSVLSLGNSLQTRTGCAISYIDKPEMKYVPVTYIPPPNRQRLSESVKKVITFAYLDQIEEKLNQRGRILLKSPTGTGKTVLMAAAWNSIIQFPNVSSLLLFSGSCKSLGINHNIYYSLSKPGKTGSLDALDEEVADFRRDELGIPYTILTTAFYVISLRERFPEMLVVLDEAETLHEDCSINLLETREFGFATVVTSATLGNLRGEDDTPVVEIQTRTQHPVEIGEVRWKDLVSVIGGLPQGSKSLVIAYSEPHCRLLQHRLKKGYLLLAEERRHGQERLARNVEENDVIISTNVVRSSVTIPNLTHVFDLALMYSEMYLPNQGIHQLVLSHVSESGQIQARGRVGRVGPGTYMKVVDVPKVHAAAPITFIGGIPQRAVRRLNRFRWEEAPTPLNAGAGLQFAYFASVMKRITGKSLQPGRPFVLDVVDYFMPPGTPGRRYVALFLLLETNSSIVSQMHSVKESKGDVEKRLSELYLSGRNSENVIEANARFLNELIATRYFAQEVGLITNWLPESKWPLDDYFFAVRSTSAQKAIALSLWNRIADIRGSQILGKYCDFNSCLSHADIRDSNCVIALGLSFWDGQTCNRGCMTLFPEVSDWIHEQLGQKEEIFLDVSEQVDHLPVPYARWSPTNNSGKQQLVLGFSPAWEQQVYRPGDQEFLLDSLHAAVEGCAKTEIVWTKRGSPMSSTFSFGYLNASGSMPLMLLKVKFGAGYGDDGIILDKLAKEILRLRELLGLFTKMSATGLCKASDPDVFAIYTERFFGPDFRTQYFSPKPRGLVNLFRALHPEANASDVKYLEDLRAYEAEIKSNSTAFYEAATSEPDLNNADFRKPVRATRSRKLSLHALQVNVPMGTVCLTERSASQVLDALEACVLTRCPSTMGEPDRETLETRPLGYNLVPHSVAVQVVDDMVQRDRFLNLKSRELCVGGSAAQQMRAAVSKHTGRSILELSLLDLPELISAAKATWHGEISL